MGYDLYSEDESGNRDDYYYRFNIWWWGNVLEFASQHGWKPAGTSLVNEDEEELDEWNGTYCSNDGQRVHDMDAHNLGTALRAGLLKYRTDIKGKDLKGQVLMDLEDDFNEEAIKNTIYDELGFGDDDNEEYIEGFADFCDRGAFNIH